MGDGLITAWAAAALLAVGGLFMLLAAVGVLRMPDVFTRMQATSKAATLGVGCMMLAVAVYFGDLAVATRAMAVVLFTFLTAPIGAHMIGRAAYVGRSRLWEQTLHDELRGRYRPPPAGDDPPGPAADAPGAGAEPRPGGPAVSGDGATPSDEPGPRPLPAPEIGGIAP